MLVQHIVASKQEKLVKSIVAAIFRSKYLKQRDTMVAHTEGADRREPNVSQVWLWLFITKAKRDMNIYVHMCIWRDVYFFLCRYVHKRYTTILIQIEAKIRIFISVYTNLYFYCCSIDEIETANWQANTHCYIHI